MTNYVYEFGKIEIKDNASVKDLREHSYNLFNILMNFLNDYNVVSACTENQDFTFIFIPEISKKIMCGYILKDSLNNTLEIKDYRIKSIRFNRVNLRLGDTKEEMTLTISTDSTTIKLKVIEKNSK